MDGVRQTAGMDRAAGERKPHGHWEECSLRRGIAHVFKVVAVNIDDPCVPTITLGYRGKPSNSGAAFWLPGPPRKKVSRPQRDMPR